jgi:hypothetical protein
MPKVGYLRVYGCRAHVHVPVVGRKKLDARSVECYFLGYEVSSKAYCFFDPRTRRLLISRDVVFKEGECVQVAPDAPTNKVLSTSSTWEELEQHLDWDEEEPAGPRKVPQAQQVPAEVGQQLPAVSEQEVAGGAPASTGAADNATAE